MYRGIALRNQIVAPRDSGHALEFYCERDFSLMYALRRPKLARECAQRAHAAAVRLGRPDLAYQAAEILGAL